MSGASPYSLLDEISSINRGMLDASDRLLADKALVTLGVDYTAASAKRDVDLGFNAFTIVSEIYHRENLHSDILKAILDPNGAHGKGTIFLERFLELLQKFRPSLSSKNYGNACLERETGRIDLLIADYESGRAIVVENKINGAADRHRQLPRYLDYVEAKGLVCDAIVYLRPSGTSKPYTTGWSQLEIQRVAGLLVVIPAYSESSADICSGWLQPCREPLPDGDDAKFILKQYSLLIKKLGVQNMNKPMMERFYQKMLCEDQFQSAISLKAMIDDLAFFRAQHLQNHFLYDLAPFIRADIYKEYDVYFTGLEIGNAHLGIDIEMEMEISVFSFWDRNDRDGERGEAETLLTKMGVLADYTRDGGHFRKVFRFPSEENALYEHVSAFKKRLLDATLRVD